tara:strand:- start:947 stop:1363 length:417 start_codon:yes stop_codon:yes gene_type:complete
MSEYKLRKVPKDKSTGLPKRYVPKGLTKADKAKQVKSIKEGKDRPKVKSAPSPKRSSHVIKFEKKYGKKITDDAFISKNLLSREGIKQVLAKGRGAYYSAGSRPNVSAAAWARARLASVLTGGKARAVDKEIWNKYKK